MQFRHNAWQHLLLSVLLLAASPLVLGISNLDASQSAKVLETYVALVGILLSLLFSALLTLIFLLVMRAGDCEMEPVKYYFGTMAEVIAFGGLGVFAYAVSDNLIVGYMIPLGYYVAGISAGYRYMKKLYPFGMLTDYETKYWILGAGIVLMVCGVLVFRRRR